MGAHLTCCSVAEGLGQGRLSVSQNDWQPAGDLVYIYMGAHLTCCSVAEGLGQGRQSLSVKMIGSQPEILSTFTWEHLPIAVMERLRHQRLRVEFSAVALLHIDLGHVVHTLVSSASEATAIWHHRYVCSLILI